MRSEFQCYRSRFLHYVAQAAGLVSLDNRRLLPTAEAWNWLSLPYKEAHARLVAAIRADLRARKPLWNDFKLPPVGTAVWDVLLDLSPGTYTVGSVAKTVQLASLDPFAGTHIRAALLGPLRWLGLGTVNMAQMMIQNAAFPESGATRLEVYHDSIGITLPTAPPLRSLVELLAWATVDDSGLRIDVASVARALESGLTVEQMMHTLAELTGDDVSESAREKLRLWTHAAQKVRIRRVALLEVANGEEMQAIRSDWRLRPFLGDQLSPRHVVVRDEYKLRQRLIRRGYRVPPLIDTAADPIPRVNNEDPAYLWLALRVCQALSGMIPSPALFPGAAAHALEAELGDRLDTLQGMVDSYVGRIKQALRHTDELPEERPSDDSQGIREAVEQAQASGSALHIRYYSPYTDEESERVIEPQTIYARNGATYVEAWCRQESAPHTFRMDRILALVSA